MALKNSNYFKLDSNLDGFYTNENGEVFVVTDMIGVIGATDGPAAYPLTTAKGAPLSSQDLAELAYKKLSPTQIKNTRGHGIIYDEDGEQIGHKGQLFFKDGQGNMATLKRITNSSELILEEEEGTLLKDYSLAENGYTSDIGINLNELLRIAIFSSTSYSKGNILQLARDFEVSNTSTTIKTISLVEGAVSWVVSRASVIGTGMARLVHEETGTVLEEVSYSNPDDMFLPIYLNWLGELPVYGDGGVGEEDSGGECGGFDAQWDFKTKTFTKEANVNDVPMYSHTVKLEIIPDTTRIVGEGNEEIVFSYAHINILCMEEGARRPPNLKTGTDSIFNETEEYNVEFDEPFDDEDYSISIQINEPMQTWYSNKTVSGFTINIERVYAGQVSWTAVRV